MTKPASEGNESVRHGDTAALASAPTARLRSLDALRGFDMFWIVGGTHVVRALLEGTENPTLQALQVQFTHLEWEGFTFYDLIFPLFLFMIGVAIPFSLAKRLSLGDSKVTIYRHIAVRVVVLVVLGMMVNGRLLTYDPAKFEITYSVLQMLAIGYMAASLLYLNLRLKAQIVVTAAMLIGYWLLLGFVPVEGHQPGVYAPGKNFGDWLNDRILGDYQGRWRFGWILASLGHASTAMLGVFAGQLLRSGLSDRKKVAVLIGLGTACLAAAFVWSGRLAELFPAVGGDSTSWTQWPVWFPIIKRRWTSTYVLWAGGLSFLLLSAFYLVIDVWKLQRWSFPFVVIGCNSIFAYMCWQLGSRVFRDAAGIFLSGLEQYTGQWYAAISWAGATFVLWLLLWYLYRNRTFIRV